METWAAAYNLDLLLTIGGLTDHTDHITSATAARLAATALGRNGRATDILDLQHDYKGDWVAQATRQSIEATFNAGALHASQFLMSRTVIPGWKSIGNLSVHPDSMRALDYYPIRRHAFYHYLPAVALQGAVHSIMPEHQ